MAATTELTPILTPIQPEQVTASNTTLFHIAAERLGDASMWNYILGMNPGLINSDGLWDYQISGVQAIALPITGQSTSNGGILNAFPAPSISIPDSFNADFNYQFIGGGATTGGIL